MARSASNAEKVRQLMRRLGRDARGPGRIFLVGGASAVLVGWRDTTIDVDLKLLPEPRGVFEAISRAKLELDMNVELAAPDDFLPALPGWVERSIFIDREGRVDFFHYDFFAQALAKIERGHEQDLDDVRAMFRLGLIQVDRMQELFARIEPRLNEFPAIEPACFRCSVESALADLPGGHGRAPDEPGQEGNP